MDVTTAISMVKEKLDDTGNKYYSDAEIKQMLYTCEQEIFEKSKLYYEKTGRGNAIFESQAYLDVYDVDYVVDGSNMDFWGYDKATQVYLGLNGYPQKIEIKSPDRICSDNAYDDFVAQTESAYDVGTAYFTKVIDDGADTSLMKYYYLSGNIVIENASLSTYSSTLLDNRVVWILVDYVVALLRAKNKEITPEIKQAMYNIDKTIGVII